MNSPALFLAPTAEAAGLESLQLISQLWTQLQETRALSRAVETTLLRIQLRVCRTLRDTKSLSVEEREEVEALAAQTSKALISRGSGITTLGLSNHFHGRG